MRTITGHVLGLGLVVAVVLACLDANRASAQFQPGPRQKIGAERKSIATLSGHTAEIYSVAVSPDGNMLASGGEKSVRLWDLREGKAVANLPGTAVLSVAFSPDGKTLAAGGLRVDEETRRELGVLTLWDLRSGEPRATLPLEADAVYSVEFSPDGKTVAVAGSMSDKETRRDRGVVTLWDTVTGRAKVTRLRDGGLAFSIAYSPDGRLLATGATNAIKLWDAVTGKLRAQLQGHRRQVWTLAFSRDGRTLASAGEDKSIILWDVKSREPKATLRGHAGTVSSVVFSNDGRTLASAGEDKTILLWELKTRQPRVILRGHAKWVRSVVFSPDGRALASGSEDATIRLWDARTGDAVADDDPDPGPKPPPEERDDRLIAFDNDAAMNVAIDARYGDRLRRIVQQQGEFYTNPTSIRMNGQVGVGRFRERREEEDASWSYRDMRVTQFMKAVRSKTGRLDTCLVTYRIENNGRRTGEIDLRVALDAHIGENKRPYFLVGNTDEVTVAARDFREARVPAVVRVLESRNLRSPGQVATLTLRNLPDIQPPNRFSITRNFFPEQWEIPVREPRDDSAVVMYWDRLVLKPGQTLTVGYAYGLGEFPTRRRPERPGLTRLTIEVVDGRDEEELLPARIRIRGGGVRTQRSVEGVYSRELRPGSYAITIESRGYETLAKTINIPEGERRIDMVAPLERSKPTPKAYTLRLNFIDPQGEPVTDVRVRISAPGIKAESRDRSPYSWRLKPGRYTLDVKRQEFEPQKLEVAIATADLTRDVSLKPVSPTPPKEHEFLIQVVDHDDPMKPIAGLEFLSSVPGVKLRERMDEGLYLLSAAPGTLQIGVEMPGHESNTIEVTVPGKEDDNNIVLLKRVQQSSPRVPPGELKDRLDKNGDGILNSEDFTPLGWQDLKHLDTNRDGELDSTELNAGQREEKQGTNEKQSAGGEGPAPIRTPTNKAEAIQQAIAALDRGDDNDSQVDKADFTPQGWEDLARFDANKDGVLQTVELEKLVWSAHLRNGPGKAQRKPQAPPAGVDNAEKFISSLDRDNSGAVDESDFTPEGWLDIRRFDRDGDGQLSDRELAAMGRQPGNRKSVKTKKEDDPVKGKLVIHRKAVALSEPGNPTRPSQ